MTIDARAPHGPTLAAPDDDPHLHLEEIDGAAAVAWADAETAKTVARFGDAAFNADADTLRDLFDRPDKIPFIRRRGRFVYNFWRDAANPRGLWRRATLESYRSDAPDWDVLLDLDALAAAEEVDWVWSGATTLAPDHVRTLIFLSRGGADAVEIREFDMAARIFVEDGFRLPEAKGVADWLDADTLIVATALGEDRATRAGYARTARLWRRGAAFDTASTLFEVPVDRHAAWAFADRTGGAERIWFIDRVGFFDEVWRLGDRSGPTTTLDAPSDAWVWPSGDWLAIKLRHDWEVGGVVHKGDALLGIGLQAFLDGDRAFETLFTPSDRRVLDGYFWCGGRLVAAVLDDLRPIREIWTPSPDGWRVARDESAPAVSTTGAWPLDQDAEASDGAFLSTVETPLSPPSLTLVAPDAAPAVLKTGPARFDAAGLITERRDAIASDGERIPYVITGPAAAPSDAPVHLTGYGGFGITQAPHYNTSIGKLWLERGGVSVVANIRGGGEFGTAWHDAGRGANKIVSHDDFAAVADDLVRRGVTTPKRIAAEGGSNGGLLIANMLTRWPERFGALFCTIPLVDMRRYAKLLAGPSWIAEYGDPDAPEDWAHLQKISAYHLAEPGRAYPPILIATTRRDDRVHPGHARKFAAKLSALGATAHYYELAGGGHGYGANNADRARFTALGLRFLAETIGWRPTASS